MRFAGEFTWDRVEDEKGFNCAVNGCCEENGEILGKLKEKKP